MNDFWFLQKPMSYIIYALFVLLPTTVVILVIVLVSLCFSFVQHVSWTLSVLQSFLNIVIGAIAIALQRASFISEIDKDNQFTSKVTQALEKLHSQASKKRNEKQDSLAKNSKKSRNDYNII